MGDGVRQAEISRLERDRVTLPRRQRLEQIARALDVPIGELLVRSGWAGAGQIDETASPDDAYADVLRSRNEELKNRAERLESTVDVLASTNVNLRSQLIELERESLRQEQAHDFAESVLDGVSDPVAVLDANGELFSENEAFTDLRGNHGLTRITTADGTPITDSISSFSPANHREEFTTTVVVIDDSETAGWHEVHVRPITVDGVGRFSVITVRQCAAPGEPDTPCAEAEEPQFAVEASD